MSQFSDAIKDSNKPREKTRTSAGSDFVKLTTEHTTVIRVLDKTPVVTWSHYVPKRHSAFPNANAGKGMSFMCPGRDVCPICDWNRQQRVEAGKEKPKNLLNSRKVYTFNVVDRTPVVICPKCSMEYYEKDKSGFPEECSNPDCGTSLVDVESQPRNKIQIFQRGIKVMDQFTALENEFGDVGTFDIKLDTRVTNDQTSTICVPKQATKLNLKEVLGEDWKEHLYKIEEVVKPMSVEDMAKILGGEDYYSVKKQESK
jgi:hypothetical protein